MRSLNITSEINSDPVVSLSPHAEFLVIKRCLMGFGKCKDSCLTEETEIQSCKTKKCCIGSKVTQLIKSYLRHEIPHIPDQEIVEMMKSGKNASQEMKIKRALTTLSQSQPTSLVPTINYPVKGVTTRYQRCCMKRTTPAKRSTRQSRGSARATPQPRPGPP
ncbi:beta-defensin 129 [Meriones unguiculatus]|uniref:beta-defensin 129 n=1 Tax=Meriones unguiculatus TaxID=10047 RepID=UPI00293EF1C3|nr:beta-defensin 129 [Meriones unguiculatus]